MTKDSTTEGASTGAPSALDEIAIERAADALQFRWPITIVVKPGPLLLDGYANPAVPGVRRFRSSEHVIELRADLPRGLVVWVLLHELRHCRDAEDYGDEWPAVYTARRDYFEDLADALTKSH